MGTPSLVLNESLFDSDRVQDWADAKPRVYSRTQMEALLEQLRRLQFEALNFGSPPTADVHPVGSTPWNGFCAAVPTKHPDSRQDILALGVWTCPNQERWRVCPGFLRWNNRWYFSITGDDFKRELSSTTLWRMRRKA